MIALIEEQKQSKIVWIFACCWMTYLSAYLCRVNFSSAMDALSLQEGLSPEKLGIVGAVFYGVYACGQLVNGYIGDRVRPDRFIILALLGTTLCNVLMSVAQSLPMMLVCWGLNGVFQSMFWSTIIRVLAQNIPAQQRGAISSGISLAMPAAYIVSWCVLGRCFEGVAAHWYFLVPAAVSLLMIGGWVVLSKRLTFAGVPEEKKSIKETVRFIQMECLWWLIPVCLLHGLIKEGVAYWTPLLISGMGITQKWPPFLLVGILPLANLVGILLSKTLLKRVSASPYLVLALVAGLITLVCIGLLAGSGELLMILLMALVSGLCYANNTVLMSYIPMGYTKQNMVASIIGVFDFASYAGAAVSTYILGKVLQTRGFGPVPGIWLTAAVVVVVLVFVMLQRDRKRNKETV